MAVILQKIRKSEPDPYKKSLMYFRVLFGVNDIHLSKREMEVISFAAVRGNVSSAGAQLELMERFGLTANAKHCIVSALKKKGFLMKGRDGKIRLVPSLLTIDFSNDLFLQIAIDSKTKDNNGNSEETEVD